MIGWETARRQGTIAMLVAMASLAACADHSVVRQGRVASRPPPRAAPLPSSQDFRMCAARLETAQVRYEALPNRDNGNGCTIIDAVRLMDIGTPTANLGPMTCPLASTFAAWARYAVRPAARLYLQSEVVRIETFGTYACRDVRGTGGTIAGKRSEHARANAVDVSAFVLADGRRISVQNDWRAGGAVRRFLQAIHDSACRRFPTVLSPDYNAAHHDHFHFDMGGRGGFCR